MLNLRFFEAYLMYTTLEDLLRFCKQANICCSIPQDLQFDIQFHVEYMFRFILKCQCWLPLNHLESQCNMYPWNTTSLISSSSSLVWHWHCCQDVFCIPEKFFWTFKVFGAKKVVIPETFNFPDSLKSSQV